MKFIYRSFAIIFTLLYRSIRDILGSTSYFMTVAIFFLHATARSAALHVCCSRYYRAFIRYNNINHIFSNLIKDSPTNDEIWSLFQDGNDTELRSRCHDDDIMRCPRSRSRRRYE